MNKGERCQWFYDSIRYLVPLSLVGTFFHSFPIQIFHRDQNIFFHWTQSKYVINYVICRAAIEKSIERLQQSNGQRSKWVWNFCKTFEEMEEIQRFESFSSVSMAKNINFDFFVRHKRTFCWVNMIWIASIGESLSSQSLWIETLSSFHQRTRTFKMNSFHFTKVFTAIFLVKQTPGWRLKRCSYR